MSLSLGGEGEVEGDDGGGRVEVAPPRGEDLGRRSFSKAQEREDGCKNVIG